MPNSICRLLLLASALFGATLASWSASAAEWTVMVYMNAKNNLEEAALANYSELSEIGSSHDVNVLVEMGRPSHHLDSSSWSGVLRFRVAKGKEPEPENAEVDLRSNPELSDLGSKLALSDFVNWSVHRYPAKRYMLIIWNHGQGWRFQTSPDEIVRATAAGRASVSGEASSERMSREAAAVPPVGGYKAVSFDQDTGHYLFNSDVADVTNEFVSKNGRKLDIVGFDACLMSMFETAYALQDSTALIVASEELEPSAGWDYRPILKNLINKPTSSARELSKIVLSAYKARYADTYRTTLSVLDATQIKPASRAISAFAESLLNSLGRERGAVKIARSKITSFGASDGVRTSIDLDYFLEYYASKTTSNEMKLAAQQVRTTLKPLIVNNYASKKVLKPSGARGIAIYFPSDKSDFEDDRFHDGYLKDNTDHVVAFVAREKWSDFIHDYIK